MFLVDEKDANLMVELFLERNLRPGWILVGYMIANSFLNQVLFCINS